MNFIFVGLAGFFGAILRVGLGNLLLNFGNNSFPYHTLVINLLGSFLLAYFLAKIEVKRLKALNSKLKLVIATGFLGSFTTFSTFSIETLLLINLEKYSLAFLYVLLSFFGGFLSALFGFRLARANLSKGVI